MEERESRAMPMPRSPLMSRVAGLFKLGVPMMVMAMQAKEKGGRRQRKGVPEPKHLRYGSWDTLTASRREGVLRQ